MRLFFTFLILVSFSSLLQAQSATPVIKAQLPNELNEISGMIHVNGKLFGIEDSQNTSNIFEFDSTSGVITKTITLGVTNLDWESLTFDGSNIYVGETGNNIQGSKTNFKFYKFPIQLINDISGATGSIPSGDIEVINFSYPEQTEASRQFDCEAVLYHDGNLHLFTKNWVGNHTVHYTVPSTAGTYNAQKLDSLDTEGILITDATKMNDRIVALLGYKDPDDGLTTIDCAVWLISGFTDITNLFAGATETQNINIGLAVNIFNPSQSRGQLESITAVNQTRVIIANENTGSDAVMQRIYGLDLSPFIAQELLPFGIENFTSRLTDNQVLLTWEYNDPGAAYFEVEAANSATGSYSYMGKVYSNPAGGTYSFTDNNLGNSAVKYYRIKIVSPDGKNHYSKTLQVKKDESKLFNLLAMPSPFTSNLNISFYSDTDQVIQLSVVDIQGRPIKTRQLQTNRGRYNFTLDELHGLSKGVYFLTARTKTDLFVRKVLKQ